MSTRDPRIINIFLLVLFLFIETLLSESPIRGGGSGVHWDTLAHFNPQLDSTLVYSFNFENELKINYLKNH